MKVYKSPERTSTDAGGVKYSAEMQNTALGIRKMQLLKPNDMFTFCKLMQSEDCNRFFCDIRLEVDDELGSYQDDSMSLSKIPKQN